MATKKDREAAEALASLRGLLKPRDTVYCILRHVSASGLSRVIDLAVVTSDPTYREGKPYLRRIGYLMARAGGHTWDRDRGGIKIQGCGMDMGFELVYQMGHKVWPDGTPEPHGTRNGEPDRDGGYALNHEWL